MAIANLCFLYLLSGQDYHLTEAKRWIDTVLGYEKWGYAHLVNVDLSASWILFGLSLGYDWIRNDLDQDYSDRIKNKLIHHTNVMFKYREDTFGKGWASNFFQNHNWINMAGIAAAGYVLKNDTLDASKWIKASKDNFERVYSYMPDDGSSYEGVVYWRYGAMWLFVYADLLKKEEGIDYFKTNQFLKNTFYYRLYQATPNLEETMNFGDCHDYRSGHSVAVYYKVASEYQNGHAQKLGNIVVNDFLYKEQYQSGIKPGILSEAFFEYLWYEPRVSELDFDDLPRVHHFPDLGLITYRSSWDKNATMLSFKCGYPGGKKQWTSGWKLLANENIDAIALSHHHPDNTSFIINSYGSYAVIDEGYNRNLHGSDHSIVTINGESYPVENVNDVLKESAKKLMKENSDFDPVTDYFGTIDDFNSENGITVFTGSTHKTLDPKFELIKLSRTIVTTDNNYFIIIDDILANKPHKYQWNLNTPEIGVKQSDSQNDYINGFSKMNLFKIHPKTQESNFENYIKAVMTTQEPDNYHEAFLKVTRLETKTESNNTKFVNVVALSDVSDPKDYKLENIENGFIIQKSSFRDVFLFSKNNQPIGYDNIASDAQFIILSYEQNELVKYAVYHGKELIVNNKKIVNEKNTGIYLRKQG